MNYRGKDGVPRRVHLEKAASARFASSGREEARRILASEPALPILCADVWASFLELHIRRARDQDGPLRFSWTELHSYSGQTGVRFDPWQRRVLFAFEDAYFEVLAEHKEK